MGRPKKSAAEKLTEVICLPMTKQQHRCIIEQAKERGLRPQAYLRHIIECASNFDTLKKLISCMDYVVDTGIGETEMLNKLMGLSTLLKTELKRVEGELQSLKVEIKY